MSSAFSKVVLYSYTNKIYLREAPNWSKNQVGILKRHRGNDSKSKKHKISIF